jgi:hypothetical protein
MYDLDYVRDMAANLQQIGQNAYDGKELSHADSISIKHCANIMEKLVAKPMDAHGAAKVLSTYRYLGDATWRVVTQWYGLCIETLDGKQWLHDYKAIDIAKDLEFKSNAD